jgi:hypothetical protein
MSTTIFFFPDRSRLRTRSIIASMAACFPAMLAATVGLRAVREFDSAGVAPGS